ncbi:DUF4292 domain-containing protein [Hymenobacter sp. BT683]|uniref:DUF4292 domain-containing protein n=1 Tax=Hymenobacter jeongseonensis TaxID=2791027 RepID=A0ABS0IC73_9BACT|nr:DUF4292 domain-containing protein [Hymenobacter jeongseonensis]MBF9235767.1 DUF4292 domain-containing protein [Hymenobacter jeongseonensis]
MNKVTLLLALGLLVGSCARKAVPTASTTGPGTSAPIAEPSVRAINTSFLFLSAKGKAQVTMKGGQQGANLALRMRRDSIIWVSASLAGIEGVRAVLTPDSVQVLNRLEKTYFSGGYDYLSKLLNVPVTFEQMQALLLGDYLPAPDGTTPKVTEEENGRQRVTYPLADVIIERLLQGGTGRVQQLKVSDASLQRNLTVDYTDFRPLDEQSPLPFAHATFIQAQQPSSGVVTAAINFTKVNAGRERLAFPFTVPKGFKRQK